MCPFNNGKNVFYDENGKMQLSDDALWFIGDHETYAFHGGRDKPNGEFV